MSHDSIIFTKNAIPSWNNWSLFWLDFDAFFVALDEGNEPFDGPLKFTLDGAFPDGRHAVTQQGKLPARLDIAYYVVRKLIVPKTAVGFRTTRHFTTMLMPKTSIYKYDCVVLQDEQVG